MRGKFIKTYGGYIHSSYDVVFFPIIKRRYIFIYDELLDKYCYRDLYHIVEINKCYVIRIRGLDVCKLFKRGEFLYNVDFDCEFSISKREGQIVLFNITSHEKQYNWLKRVTSELKSKSSLIGKEVLIMRLLESYTTIREIASELEVTVKDLREFILENRLEKVIRY